MKAEAKIDERQLQIQILEANMLETLIELDDELEQPLNTPKRYSLTAKIVSTLKGELAP